MDLTIGKFLRFVIVLFFLVVIGWLIYTLREIITIIIIASLIAYIFDPLASYIEAKGFSRTSATTFIFILVFVVIGVSAWFLLPALYDEIFTLQRNLNPGGASEFIITIETFLKNNFSFLDVESLNLDQKINNLLSSLADQLLSILANAISIISVIVIIPFVVFFLLKDGRNMKKVFISYIPNRYFEMTLNIIHKIDTQLGSYLRGQITEAFVVGVLATLALWILDVQYYIVIGVFAGLANMIPYIGPVAGMIPALIVSIINGGEVTLLLYIILAFGIVQLVDNILVQPLVLSRSVNLHPLVIVLAVLIGGKIFGLLGMLLAVPTAGILKVTSSEMYNGIRKFNLI